MPLFEGVLFLVRKMSDNGQPPLPLIEDICINLICSNVLSVLIGYSSVLL